MGKRAITAPRSSHKVINEISLIIAQNNRNVIDAYCSISVQYYIVLPLARVAIQQRSTKITSISDSLPPSECLDLTGSLLRPKKFSTKL